MFSKFLPSYPFMQDPEFKCMQKYFEFDSTAEYALDFGHIISNHPMAVFFPPSVELLQRFIQLASRYKIKIVCRGKGNSAYGQAQCLNGVVIDLKNLNLSMDFVSENKEAMIIPAFKTWLEVTNYSLVYNKTVPVTVDNLDLTVMGTLCFGGLGGTSYRVGSGADNVLSLDVITMDGEIHTCSSTQNNELFQAVLCGLGQFGIVLTVTIPLIEAKKSTNMYLFSYNDISLFFKDQKMLYDKKVFDHLKGMVQKKENRWEYIIEAAAYFNDKEDSLIEETISRLSPSSTILQVQSYQEFINLVTNLVQALKNAKKLEVPHPWYNALLTEDYIEEHLIKVLESHHLTGAEPIIVYPMNSDLFNQPFFMKPNSPVFYLLGVLFNTSFEAREDFPYQAVIEDNKALYAEVKKQQGSRYLVDANAFTKEDWHLHYDLKWDAFYALKQKYDPYYLLGSGFNIFSEPSCELELIEQNVYS